MFLRVVSAGQFGGHRLEEFVGEGVVVHGAGQDQAADHGGGGGQGLTPFARRPAAGQGAFHQGDKAPHAAGHGGAYRRALTWGVVGEGGHHAAGAGMVPVGAGQVAAGDGVHGEGAVGSAGVAPALAGGVDGVVAGFRHQLFLESKWP
ncbi:hypothetical protein HML84_20270 [Alcanivorax sp. IO_7]|nr:hypothetical protein HML84_20270 [Alcanivorax sp. IO_7]